jgi:hypothetical protein
MGIAGYVFHKPFVLHCLSLLLPHLYILCHCIETRIPDYNLIRKLIFGHLVIILLLLIVAVVVVFIYGGNAAGLSLTLLPMTVSDLCMLFDLQNILRD